MIGRVVNKSPHIPLGNIQRTSNHIQKQAQSPVNGITSQSMGKRTQRNHEVIDINLNINLNVNDKPHTNITSSNNLPLNHQPPAPTYFSPRYQPGSNPFNQSNGRMPHALPSHRIPLARPSASSMRIPEIFKRMQRVVVMPPPLPNATMVINTRPASHTVVTEVVAEPPKQCEDSLIATHNIEVVDKVVPSLVTPMTTIIPPLPPLVQNSTVGCYIPSTIIDSDEMLTCVLCKEKYLVRDKQRHSNKHRMSLTHTRGSGTMSQTIVNSLEKDIRQSDMTGAQLHRMTIELDPRQRVRDLFQAESGRLSYNIVDLAELAAQDNNNTYIRHVNSVALRGSQDIRMTVDRPESYRINHSLRAPSFMGPHFRVGGSNVPSMIPGVTPEFFVSSNNQVKENPYQRGILATIPSVISERNSAAYSSSHDENDSPTNKLRQQANLANFSTQMAGASSGQYLNSWAG